MMYAFEMKLYAPLATAVTRCNAVNGSMVDFREIV